MKNTFLWALGAWCLPLASGAPGARTLYATIHNFNPDNILNGEDGLTPSPYAPLVEGAPVIHVSEAGNMVEEHNGHIAYLDGRYYMYSDSWACGKIKYFAGQVSGYGNKTEYPAGDYGGTCGTLVHSSTDLMHWRLERRIALEGFDSAAKVKVRWNAARGKYVMVFSGGDGYNLVTTGGIFVAEADSPVGPWSKPVVLAGDHLAHGFALVTDADGTDYIVTDVFSGVYQNGTHIPLWDIWLQQLTPDWSGTVGTNASAARALAAMNFEGLGAFYARGRFYITGGPTCGNCEAAITYYSAPAIAGPWDGPVDLAADGCTGQGKSVQILPSPDGDFPLASIWGYRTSPSDYAARGSVQHGDNSQAISSTYWYPLRFDADSSRLLPLACNASVEVPLAPATDFTTVGPIPEPYQPDCRVRNSSVTTQRWSVPRNLGRALQLPVFQRVDNLGPYSVDGPVLDAALDVRVTYFDGSVTTASFPASNVSWTPEVVTIPLKTVFGTSFISEIALSTSAANGCFGTVIQPRRGLDGYLAQYGVVTNGTRLTDEKAMLYIH